ncbi:hypothetical protein BKA70DRAFT_1309073 [Coprinopsis sp. MPI-PUGE-AT-0042]|nr:hypothetical protein BKA70DRAFT_1309073 [Coprinopsis sp. MPI-PUGE-AT-0042]
MAFRTLLVAVVALVALQVSAAPAETCPFNPCKGIICVGFGKPVVVPALYPGTCSTCKCVLNPGDPVKRADYCPPNPCKGVFCIATTIPTIVPGLHPGDCSTCECVPIPV